MFNELLWLGFAILDLTLTLVVFRFFGRAGLFALIVMNVIICNIQVLKVVELFGLTTTLGNVLYGSVFLITDMLGEFYGKHEARKGVLLGFITLVLAMVYMKIAIIYIPHPSDFIQPSLEAIFDLMPRIAAASLLAYAVSQTHDVWAFHFWRKKTNGRFLWLRNNASTLASQFLDSLIFCGVAFYGLYPLPVVVEILISTYVIKALVTVLETPFVYAGRKVYHTYIKDKEVRL